MYANTDTIRLLITDQLDLGLHFGEDEDDTQLEQEDKDLSYLVLAGEQEDSYDVVDTETLLAEMATGKRMNTDMDITTDTNADTERDMNYGHMNEKGGSTVIQIIRRY